MSSENEDEGMPRLKLLDFALRLSVIPLSVASLCLTLTDTDDNPDYGTIKFLDFLGLNYMVVVTAIAAVYAIFGAVAHWLGSLITKVWVFFVSDQVIAYLMVAAGAAGGELMYLAYMGDVQVTWSEACSSYGKFCNNLKIALLLHFLASFCFLILAVISAFRALSIFDPPLPTSGKEVDDP